MSEPQDPPTTPFAFTLQLGGESFSVSGSVPAGECAVEELVPLLLALGESIVAAAIRQRPPERHISCGPGCGACCRQLVPISLSEAGFLRNKVLPGLEPDHRLRVEQRLTEAAATLRESGLWGELRALPGEADRERRQAIGLRYFLNGIPCPFLEEESCSIHPQRPLACREYLVTSPVRHCASPNPHDVAPLPIPKRPSRALVQLDAAATGGPGWQTLIEALSGSPATPARMIPEPVTFLQNFLSQLLT